MLFSLFEDENKALWIGTYGGGLNRLKDGQFTALTTKQGMYDNSAFRILEDAQKNFWLTCNRGIYRVSERELNDCADGKTQTIYCTVFGMADGLRSVKCNGSCQPAGIRTRDGRLWFPTIKGAAIIDPVKIQQNTYLPPVLIERVLFDKQEVMIDSLVQVGPGDGNLEFYYTALSYAAPKMVSFKYMLVGFDKDWIDAGVRRVAYYTNVPPGSYMFKVIACNNDGVWNTKGATLELSLAAHFYQTTWFYGLVLVALGGAGFGVHRLRVWRLLVKEKMLKTYVEEAMAKIKVLNGLIPICASCKKIRNDKGYWSQLEEYINEHSEATFSHGVCPECAEKLYGGYLTKSKKQ
jgi:hypothetical protein